MTRLLLEIGTEEIPAAFIPPALEQMKSLTESLLNEARLSFDHIKVFASPRRLAVIVDELADYQPDLSEELKGPPARIALDGDGNFTKAGLGFAKKSQVEPEALFTKDLNGQIYLYASKKTTGKSAEAILPDILLNIISSLNFPKPMRWGHEETRFARPIRWLVALLDDQLLPLSYAGITADRISRSHRFLGKGQVEITDAGSYLNTLRNNYVIVDLLERKQLILKQISEIENLYNVKVDVENELLTEVVCLLEYPTAFLGNFNIGYLQLPEEAIITPMREHQRYFPVRNSAGELAPHFVGVRNGTKEYIDNVKAGNEKVLAARLSDARFFFNEDRKHPLTYYLERLKPVVFQDKLGTIYEKSLRVVELTDWLCDTLGYSTENKHLAHQAAVLCKADLTTHMVFEFPELQGVMGEKYARLEGYSDGVALAIKEHYLPQGAEDELPQSLAGSAVAIADKMDTIVGCIAVGLKATGSQDPYGLRRQAAGITRILIKNQFSVSLKSMTDLILKKLEHLDIDRQEIYNDVLDLFATRMKYLLQNDYQYNYDVVDTVAAGGVDDLFTLYRKASALMEIKQAPAFNSLINAFKRANNLAQKADKQVLDSNLFNEDAEQLLYERFINISSQYEEAISIADYSRALALFAELENPINGFFDKVLVMDKDERVRNNRLALLQMIVGLTSELGDLTQIVIE